MITQFSFYSTLGSAGVLPPGGDPGFLWNPWSCMLSGCRWDRLFSWPYDKIISALF